MALNSYLNRVVGFVANVREDVHTAFIDKVIVSPKKTAAVLTLVPSVITFIATVSFI